MKQTVIGLDVGGTKIFAGRYSGPNLEKEADYEIATEAALGREKVLANLLSAIAAVRQDDTHAIGISWAGFVNGKTGTILNAPNISALNDFNLVEYLTDKTGLKCVLENDARCFALGAYEMLPTKPTVFLGLIIGTGVGGGIIIDGKALQGENFAAGEIGHMQIKGQEIEAQIAGPALENVFNVSRLSQLDQGTLTPDTITDLIEPMVIWIYNLCLAYNPGIIAIGGGAGQHFWKHYKEMIEQALAAKMKYPCPTTLLFSDHENAGAQGAAALVKPYLS